MNNRRVVMTANPVCRRQCGARADVRKAGIRIGWRRLDEIVRQHNLSGVVSGMKKATYMSVRCLLRPTGLFLSSLLLLSDPEEAAWCQRLDDGLFEAGPAH